ncbi:MAG TPA: FAD-dependent monooxygenase, partial [Rhodocyclaceae bacterium]|nr:FAD-dependent monooxygenase [Rhodocyclaceae bacterium]
MDADVLIVGAGPVGITLALLLAGNGLQVRLLDRRPPDAQSGDPRALALSHGARQLLEPLGAWPDREATPIETIHISQRGGFGRTVMDRSEYGLPALGYVVRYGKLVAALRARLDPAALIAPVEIAAIAPHSDHVAVTLREGDSERTMCTRLLVHAEGTPGEDAEVKVRDYGQHAVIAEVQSKPPHGQRAWERFTPDGPLALLPLGGAFSVVFTVSPEKADHLLSLDDAGFLAALQTQFGQRLRFVGTGPRARFPLALRLRERLTAERQVWIGNTAQTLHPVSGQGFNLGLRDAWQLAETVLAHADDVGGTTPLNDYAAQRRIDRQGSAAFTDGI